ncbi:major facilitator superfamily domain-containing protein 4A-like [Haliotis cracherodii]|uniref:major facilitator superfamily domain-containing protein 4A-like n=1 Tax=Haliotis cracherodii TaxID=6455 RepID=UPI0039EBE2DB
MKTRDDISNANRIIYTTVLFGAAYVTMVSSLIGLTLPDIMCLLGVDLKTGSSLLFAYGLGLCSSSLTGHFLRGKVDDPLFLAALLVSNAVIIAALPTSLFLWLTLTLLLILGWCTGTSSFVGTLQCYAMWPNNAFGVFFMKSGASLSAIIMPLVSNLFQNSHTGIGTEESFRNTTRTHPNPEQRCNGFNTNINYLYIIMSGLGLLVAIALMCCYNAFLKDGDVMVPLSRNRKPAEHRSLSKLLTSLMLFFAFTSSTCIASFWELFVTYGIRTPLKLSLRDMSGMSSAFSSGIFLSRFASVFLSTRIRLDVLMLVYVVLTSASSVLFLVFQDTSIMMMWTNCILYAVGLGPIYPGILAWLKEYSDGSPRVLNAVLLFYHAGFFISPTICGMIMDMFGADAFIYIVSGAALLQCVLFLCLSYNNWKRTHDITTSAAKCLSD